MKKYVTGIAAVVVALSSAAFTHADSNSKVAKYWYHRNSADVYVDDGYGEAPATSCPSGSAVICAKGFSSAQTAGDIRDNTVATTVKRS